jgi:YHS domain-containing protein
MKRLTVLVVGAVFVLASANYALAGGTCGMSCDMSSKGSNAYAAEKAVMASNKYCPVSGEAIEKGHEKDITYEYNSKIYSFCCPACLKPFKADPKKYIKALEEKEKTGKDASAAPSTHEHMGH